MSITINLYYTGKGDAARKFAVLRPSRARLCLLRPKIPGDRRTMPSVAAKLSCKLMLAAAWGFASKRMARMRDNEVIESLSRFKSGASSRQSCINTARTTEGVKPVIAANRKRSGTNRTALRRLLGKNRRTKPTRKETCIPETAVTCINPALLRA